MNNLMANNLNWLVPTAVTITGIYLKYKHNKEQVENQNNLAYYSERLKIYHSIQEILCKLISSPDNAETLWLPFLQKTRDVPFLFGKDIQDKCKEIYEDIIDILTNNEESKPISVQLECAKCTFPKLKSVEYEKLKTQHTRLVEEKRILLKRIINYNASLPKIFQPYIGTVKDQTTPKISYHPYPSVLSIPPAP